MAESGFKDKEVKCTCGESFGTVNEYLEHARSVHGVEF